MSCVLEISGKQYKVKEGDQIKVDKIKAGAGETVTFNKVFSILKDEKIMIGKPHIKGASVAAKILRHGKEKKILVFKYKPKKNYRVKSGHRKQYTVLKIEKIKELTKKTPAEKEEKE